MSFEANEHVSEESFEGFVEELLKQTYKPTAVHRQYRFADSGRIADFLVKTPTHDVVMELENDAGSLPNGLGQTLLYQQARLEETDRSVSAVLCFPEDHIDAEERELLQRTGIRLWEVPLPEDVDTEGV